MTYDASWFEVPPSCGMLLPPTIDNVMIISLAEREVAGWAGGPLLNYQTRGLAGGPLLNYKPEGAPFLVLFARSGAFRLTEIHHTAPRIFIFNTDQSLMNTGPVSPNSKAALRNR